LENSKHPHSVYNEYFTLLKQIIFTQVLSALGQLYCQKISLKLVCLSREKINRELCAKICTNGKKPKTLTHIQGKGAAHILYNALRGGRGFRNLYMYYMRDRVFMLMLYNAQKSICIT